MRSDAGDMRTSVTESLSQEDGTRKMKTGIGYRTEESLRDP
jgi:hypothetical protein